MYLSVRPTKGQFQSLQPYFYCGGGDVGGGGGEAGKAGEEAVAIPFPIHPYYIVSLFSYFNFNKLK